LRAIQIESQFHRQGQFPEGETVCHSEGALVTAAQDSMVYPNEHESPMDDAPYGANILHMNETMFFKQDLCGLLLMRVAKSLCWMPQVIIWSSQMKNFMAGL